MSLIFAQAAGVISSDTQNDDIKSIKIKRDRCKGCSLCVKACPFGAITMNDEVAEIGSDCMQCGVCVNKCPFGAIGTNLEDELEENNSEINITKSVISINKDKCKGCFICLKACPFDAITHNNKMAEVNSNCTGCEVCVNRCPFEAIEKNEIDIIDAYDFAIDETLETNEFKTEKSNEVNNKDTQKYDLDINNEKSIKERLLELKEIYDMDLISHEEYEKVRMQILSEM